MNTDMLFNAAHSTAISLLESGAYVTPADTVCAVESGSGRIFTGISHADMNNSVHAEVEAIQNMLAVGENVIQEILLISTQGREPLLPCNNCIGYILSLSPDNAGCMIVMNDRMINIAEVGMYAAPVGAAPDSNVFAGAYSAPPPASSHARGSRMSVTPSVTQGAATAKLNSANFSGDMLKNKVHSLMDLSVGDEEEEEKTEKKKGFFGFFRK